MDTLVKIELVVVGIILILLAAISALYLVIKNDKIAKLLQNIKDALISIIKYA